MDIRRKTVEAQTEARTVADQNLVAGKRRAAKDGTASTLLEETDTVDVSLGKTISSTVSEDRQKRIDELKALIDRKQYPWDAKAVASSLMTHIDEEIRYEHMSGTSTADEEEL